ncbi:MAG: DUF2974 domain-containing protein [Oscillospiraceae bacterium]|nr:DUF2974 domain-containing protein [Oscillospiraceae bacterium]
MDSLRDYILWMGDFPVEATGLRDPDALILCAIAYYDLAPALKDGRALLRDCLPYLERGELRLTVETSHEGFYGVFSAAAASRRFGDLLAENYVDVYRQEPPLQFSAVEFSGESFSFIAYRGTDNSLAGWREDFMISFTRTAAQNMALEYAASALKPGRRYYMGGHSNGANLALFAACTLPREQWDLVDRLYLLDGPGLCPEVMDAGVVERIDRKTVRVIPRFSVVGKLFEPKVSNTIIVNSSRSGFPQHMLASWLVDHGQLSRAEKNDPMSLLANETLDSWIQNINQEDRATFVADLFDALAAGGAETLHELEKGGGRGLEAIIRRLAASRGTTFKVLYGLPVQFFKTGLSRLRDAVAPRARQEREEEK